MNPADRRFFDTFGYLHLRGLLRERFAEIADAFEEIVVAAHDGVRPRGRVSVANMLGRHETLAALSFSPPLRPAIAHLLGDDFSYVGSSGQVFDRPSTPWHADDGAGRMRELPFRALRIAIYLDDLDPDSGCLRVIPGSHHRGDRFEAALTDELGPRYAEDGARVRPTSWQRPQHELPSVPLPSRPGDVVLFDTYVKHGAFAARGERRLLTMTFTPRVADAEAPAFRQLIAQTGYRNAIHGDATPNPVSDLLRAAPGAGPHLEQLRRNADAYAVGCRVAREAIAAARPEAS